VGAPSGLLIISPVRTAVGVEQTVFAPCFWTEPTKIVTRTLFVGPGRSVRKTPYGEGRPRVCQNRNKLNQIVTMARARARRNLRR